MYTRKEQIHSSYIKSVIKSIQIIVQALMQKFSSNMNYTICLNSYETLRGSTGQKSQKKIKKIFLHFHCSNIIRIQCIKLNVFMMHTDRAEVPWEKGSHLDFGGKCLHGELFCATEVHNSPLECSICFNFFLQVIRTPIASSLLFKITVQDSLVY